ncbi:MAG: universal stress protein [Candidatus Bathyarchaeota archaeon]|nr:universal stress protein [Candidatus Bathyarchaeota archaeon]
MIQKILVALDGSEPSERALEYAVEFAERWSAELTLLAVIPRVMLPVFPDEGFGATPIAAAKDFGQYQERMSTIYQNVLTEAETDLRRDHPEVKVVTRLEEGRPSSTIVGVAEEDDFDLIVMGSRGIGGITGWILGSTSRRVVDSCTKPILIVK